MPITVAKASHPALYRALIGLEHALEGVPRSKQQHEAFEIPEKYAAMVRPAENALAATNLSTEEHLTLVDGSDQEREVLLFANPALGPADGLLEALFADWKTSGVPQ